MTFPVTRRLRPLVLACASALVLPLLLLGPEREAHGVPCAASVEEARRHMDRGLELYDKEQFREAASEFDAAYQAQPFSASLCNAAMAYERALDFKNAIARYRSFLSAGAQPPDLARIKTVLAWLEAQYAAQREAHPIDSDGGAPDAATPSAAALDGGADAAVVDGGAPPPSPVEIRSQVVVESDPPGAPLSVYLRKAGALAFVSGATNTGWQKVLTGEKTPHDISLAAGEYHIVLEAFRDLKRSETDLELRPGRVYNFKANLSQGRVPRLLAGDVAGRRRACPRRRPAALRPRHLGGRAPHGDLLEPGEHSVWIEATGYETQSRQVTIERGETIELAVPLERVRYGFSRRRQRRRRQRRGRRRQPTARTPRSATRSRSASPRARTGRARRERPQDLHGRRRRRARASGRRARPPRLHAAAEQRQCSAARSPSAAVGGVALLRQPSYELREGPRFPGLPRFGPTGTQPWFKIGGAVSFGVSGLLVVATGYSLLNDPNPASSAKIDQPRELDADASAKSPPAADRKKTGIRLEGMTPEVCLQGGGLTFRGTFSSW